MSTTTLPKLADIALDHRKLFRLVLFFISGILAAIAIAIPSRAGENRTLIIPPSDGYGFDECLKAGSECGLIVADSWCRAHGFGASKSFGPEDAGAAGAAPGSFLVTCGDRVN
jgi:hypothetical protein